MFESSVQVSVIPLRHNLQPVSFWPWPRLVIVTASNDFLEVDTTTHRLSWAHASGSLLGYRITGPSAPGGRESPPHAAAIVIPRGVRAAISKPSVSVDLRAQPRDTRGSAVDSEFC